MKSKAKQSAPVVDRIVANMEYILALDLSLEHTGYALANLATREIQKGLIEPSGLKGMARLAFLRTHVLSLALTGHLTPAVDEIPGWPPVTCLVLIEGYAYGAKGAAVVSLGELGGTIRLALWETRVPYLEVPPTQVKKFTTGKGNAPKQIMLKEVFKRFGEDIDDDNIADAFALLQLGLALVEKPSKPLVAFQEQVLSEIRKGFRS